MCEPTSLPLVMCEPTAPPVPTSGPLPVAPTALALTCGHPELKRFLTFTEALHFNDDLFADANVADTEFFSVSLSVTFTAKQSITDEELLKMMEKFPATGIIKNDHYECKAVASPQPQPEGDEFAPKHYEETIYFTKRNSDGLLSVVRSHTKQDVHYNAKRFAEKVQQEALECLDDIRSDEFPATLKLFLEKLSFCTGIADYLYSTHAKAERRASRSVEARRAQEKQRWHDDVVVGHALYQGLQTRRLICNGPAELLPV